MSFEVATDSWIVDEESVESLARDIMQKINARNRLSRNTLAFSRADTQIRTMLTNFDDKFSKLQQQLVRDSQGYTVTRMEVERRQRLLDNLSSKRKQIDLSYNNPNVFVNNDYSSIGQRLGEAGTSSSSNFDWNENANANASRNMTVDDLRSQRQLLMQEQDKGLDILGDIITKQKYMAKGISSEIDTQNEILDDIHGAMDQTTDRLIRNTRNIKKVGRKADSCWYWVIIVLLLIAIITVISV
ncbi:syntaxin-8-like protein [Dinothrombium tinctorium]|uniref:Syntaxin-8-like protein n=1 Tax=Dinothrombium tinctorium TaxID=1965070 RepID=A0A3S3PD23_9ACAR|nr:syntaxin-8-like protein [Dinothrombium tinctorium]RWS17027.1 syntaxin-8-like protein [Dinothrombium tinctorium]